MEQPKIIITNNKFLIPTVCVHDKLLKKYATFRIITGRYKTIKIKKAYMSSYAATKPCYAFPLHIGKKIVKKIGCLSFNLLNIKKYPDFEINYTNQGTNINDYTYVPNRDMLLNTPEVLSKSNSYSPLISQSLNNHLLLNNLNTEKNTKRNLFQLRNDQIETVNYVINKGFPFPVCSSVLVQEPGSGKTYVGIGIIIKMNIKTLIIAPTTMIFNQWRELLVKIFHKNVGFLNGKIKQKPNFNKFKIIVGLEPSVKKHINKLGSWGLTIIDECHLFTSDRRNLLLYSITSPFKLGLTATPDENIKGTDYIFKSHLGKCIYPEDIFGCKSHKWISNVKMINYYGPENLTQVEKNDKEDIDYNKILNNIVNDKYRNIIIIDKIRELLQNPQNYIYVFSDRLDHISKLITMLKTIINFLNPKEIGILVGKTKDKEIQKTIKNARVVFCTYQYISVGVSINKMNCLILASPRKNNMKQIIGRIYRKGGDELMPRQIIDIVDAKTIARYQSKNRNMEYEQRRAKITYQKIKWEECARVLNNRFQ